jgi:dTDP-4-dehydrorhamnose 3,5-epimerase
MLRAMDGDWQPTALTGVLRRRLEPHADERGSLREVWRTSQTNGLGIEIRQVNNTLSRAGALRGVHFHLRQTDLWVVLDGDAHVGLVDIRDLLGGAADGDRPKLELSMTSGDCLLIPPGVAHGLWARTDVSLLYLVSAEYDSSDEHGFAWDDPATALTWPGRAPIISSRDAAAPALADAVRQARGL